MNYLLFRYIHGEGPKIPFFPPFSKSFHLVGLSEYKMCLYIYRPIGLTSMVEDRLDQEIRTTPIRSVFSPIAFCSPHFISFGLFLIFHLSPLASPKRLQPGSLSVRCLHRYSPSRCAAAAVPPSPGVSPPVLPR